MESILQPQLPFTVTLLLLLLFARLLGEITERFGHPAMVGEVIAGVLLGPSLFGLINYTGELRILAELAVFLLIVLAGMEIKPEEVRKSIKGKNLLIAIMGFIIPMFSGFLVGIVLDLNYMLTIFISLCISITALPVSVRILMDMGKLQSDIGQKIISAAIFNDVISLLILGIILDSKDASTTIASIAVSAAITIFKVGMFTLFIYLAYKGVQLAANKISFIHNRISNLVLYLKGKESLFALVMAFVLIFASISEILGLHFVIGAFFGAMLLNREFLGNENFDKIRDNTSGITMGFLAPIFFAGMGIQFNILSISSFWMVFLVLLASFASKILGGYLGARLAGLGKRESYTLGMGLNARGIMELVIANIALQNGFIDTSVFSVLVLMGLVTTLVSPIFLKRSFNKLDKKLLLR